VDPDNRRAVDYALRRQLLSGLETLQEDEFESHVRSVFGNLSDGRAKLYIVWRLLALRRERPAIFLHGGYTPVHAHGARAGFVVAYARRAGGAGVVVIAGRLFAALGIHANEFPCGAAVWADTRVELPFLAEGSRLRHAFTGVTYCVESGGLQLGDVCADTPGAVLVYDEGEK
jgi:(1->4)-alpha-D-glucan 1-alpha-D-glucosylmutase